MFDLDGKRALVTGAGQGVGAGIAAALARQGATVAVNDLDGERAERTVAALTADGGRAVSCVFDVTDPESVDAAARHLDAELGAIDVLVNNAGGAGASPIEQASFRDMPREAWPRYIDVNLYGVLHCTKAFLDAMCDRGFGRIVTISSEAGRSGLPIGVSIYGAAKAAAASFMRHLSFEVAPYGVTANSVSVGLMDNVPDEFAAPLVARHPTRRLGSPLDVGGAVAYLASDEAGWVTGQSLVVNGGYAAF